jgi:hypothetical protein
MSPASFVTSASRARCNLQRDCVKALLVTLSVSLEKGFYLFCGGHWAYAVAATVSEVGLCQRFEVLAH